ncbi:MAG: URC4/urg3 family protein [Burkholderiaceae bacterium]
MTEALRRAPLYGLVSADPVAALRNPLTIRERSENILAATRKGRSQWFTVDDSKLAHAARIVAEVTRQRYPSLITPYHSRWRHFEAGGVDRLRELNFRLRGTATFERAMAQIDLAVVSVLLDAGAGDAWRFTEAGTQQTLARSEGLGVASFHMFMAGAFSSSADTPLRADAKGLQSIELHALARGFQVSESNPLVGLAGRAALMQSLGKALAARPDLFGADGRPGAILNVLTADGKRSVSASEILAVLLDGLSAIWPAGNMLNGQPLGDCWPHPHAGGGGGSAGWVPFHKLSQWLTYSLLEPFEWADIEVTGLDALTGLPEYRNGGLLIDTGVLVPKHAEVTSNPHLPSSELIIEWRALTVALLDELAPLVRGLLGKSAQEMPLACVLEGGTWAAGRIRAQELRGGLPPISIISDGTVF